MRELVKRCRGVTVIVIATVFVSAGCSLLSTFDDIEAGLVDLKGQPITAAIEKIGYPDGSSEIAGRKVYVWSTDRNVTNMRSYPSYSPSGTMTPVYMTSNSNYWCKISVITDDTDVIVDHDFEGNIGGCERYAKMFNR